MLVGEHYTGKYAGMSGGDDFDDEQLEIFAEAFELENPDESFDGYTLTQEDWNKISEKAAVERAAYEDEQKRNQEL